MLAKFITDFIATVWSLFNHSNHTNLTASYDATSKQIRLAASGGGGSGGATKVTLSSPSSSIGTTGVDIISFDGLANTTYYVRGIINYTGTAASATPSIALTVPAGATMALQLFSNANTGGLTTTTTSATFIGPSANMTAATGQLTFVATVSFGSSGGTATFSGKRTGASGTWVANTAGTVLLIET